MARGDLLKLGITIKDTIQDIKAIIQRKNGVHVNNQKLMFSGIEMENDRTLKSYNITGSATLQLMVKAEDNEMGLAAGGKMKQKIYEDDAANLNLYNTKKVTRVFVNIANGNMWHKITGKELPESPLNPKMYEMYGYMVRAVRRLAAGRGCQR